MTFIYKNPPSLLVQKALRGDAWHDLQYDMFSMSDRNLPCGHGVIVISSNIVLKCHMFFQGRKTFSDSCYDKSRHSWGGS